MVVGSSAVMIIHQPVWTMFAATITPPETV
jgi:hypothetical protein